MLNQFSWQEFALVSILALTLYYTFLAVRFYRKPLVRLVTGNNSADTFLVQTSTVSREPSEFVSEGKLNEDAEADFLEQLRKFMDIHRGQFLPCEQLEDLLWHLSRKFSSIFHSPSMVPQLVEAELLNYDVELSGALNWDDILHSLD